MRSRSYTMLLSVAVMTVVAGSAAPAGAAPRAGAANAIPTCGIAGPNGLIGSQFLNGTTVNGTWWYAVGVVCSGNVADIALYAQIDHNGTKLDAHFKGFTGVSRSVDNEGYFPLACAQCGGSWTFTFGEIIQAPPGFTWVSMSGCVAASNGLYLFCVQQQTTVVP